MDLGGATLADRHDRGGAVGEEPAADQGGHRRLGRRKGEGAQFDGDECGDVVRGAAQVVVQARDARGAGHAAQAEDRYAFDVGPQAQPPGDAGVQRRHGHAGDRRRDDDVEVVRVQPGLVEGAGQGLAGEVDGVLDVEVVGFAEVGERGIPVERQDEMARVDLGVIVQCAHDVLVVGEARDPDKRVGDLVLGVAVRGQCPAYAGNDTRCAHILDTLSDGLAVHFSAIFSEIDSRL